MNGDAAIKPSLADTVRAAPVSILYSGSLTGINFAIAMMTPMITIEEPITANSGPPAYMLINNSGIANAKPANKVCTNTPLIAFTPPAMMPTMKNGVITFKKNNCTAMNVPNSAGCRPVKDANVVVGIAIEPNVVGTEFATKQAKMDFNGSNPTATIIAAGIATAVPKPAIPSMKAPKPHANNTAKIRISLVTEDNITLIVSIAFV